MSREKSIWEDKLIREEKLLSDEQNLQYFVTKITVYISRDFFSLVNLASGVAMR